MVLIVLIVISLFIRLIALNQSFWLDEAINVNNAASLSLKSLIFEYSLGDFHPPLYHVILKIWILAFGSSEISVRLPSVILGVATVLITYLMGKKLFDNKTAHIVATLISTSPLHIYYSQEARMYMLAAFLATCSVYFFISILKRDRLFYWIGFIAATTLMLYSDYLPYFLIPTYAIFLFINRKRFPTSTLKTFIPAFVLILVFIAPWFFVFSKQVNVGLAAASASPAWARVVGEPSVKNLALTFVKFTIGRISHDNNLIYALLFLPVALTVIVLFIFSLLRTSILRSFLYFWLIIPISFAYLLAFAVPIYAYFRFVFALPAFYLILSLGINSINWTNSTRSLLILMLIVNLTSVSIYFLNPKFQREDWKNATQFIQENASNETLVLFESNFPTAPFEYYNRQKIEAKGALSGFSADPNFVNQNLRNLTQGKDNIYLFQYLSGITDPSGIVFKELTSLGFVNTNTKNFQGVGFVYEFKRF